MGGADRNTVPSQRLRAGRNSQAFHGQKAGMKTYKSHKHKAGISNPKGGAGRNTKPSHEMVYYKNHENPSD
jgi:hypothetical protein